MGEEVGMLKEGSSAVPSVIEGAIFLMVSLMVSFVLFLWALMKML